MIFHRPFLLAVALIANPALSELPRQDAPEGAGVYLIAPANGAVVQSPVRIQFGLHGMGVAPAGTHQPNTGHHHLLINEPDVAEDQPLPKTEHVLHFGGGQTETTLDLAPGDYTLQLLMGDYAHIPHRPPVRSDMISITVE